ncbi:MAG TPA: ATP-binding protein [Archangium sp.]|nr:ATP-binding protein [Archangium sp.]
MPGRSPPSTLRGNTHLLRRLTKAQVLLLDDFGLEPLGASERKELLEVLEDPYGTGATVVTSQLDPKGWLAVIGDATLADAILDRLVHNAHRLKLTGDSVRSREGIDPGQEGGEVNPGQRR